MLPANPVLNLMRGRPVAAVFEICLRCNSACGYCDLPLNQGRPEMSRAEIARVFADLHRDGLRHVFVQGGEPLLRRDLLDVLADLRTIGFSLSLVTNGTRLTPAIAERLGRLGIDIAVSLDSLDRDTYRAIRGADQLRQVLRGIEALADYPHGKYLTCILSERNRAQVLEVVRFARDRGFIPVVGAYHWGVGKYGKAAKALQYGEAEAILAFEQVLASGLVPRGYFRRYLRDNIRWLAGGRLPRCDAGRHTVAINASGDVSACLAQPVAGNLLTTPLSDILAAMDRAAIARCSAASSCNLLCGRIVGTLLRHPLDALMTPRRLQPASFSAQS
jgi:MoaA/NifB/PqqE/SkfB family radical SAM enzyme